MCYNVNYLTKQKEEYARRIKGVLPNADFDKNWENIRKKTVPVYYDNGFNHPDLPVITNKSLDRLQLFSWGLIPFWVKDAKQAVDISKRTLNARGEDIFNKPSFRNAAKNKRCLILLDGFFEYHWKENKSYPFYIQMKNSEPMFMAGLWETWKYEKEGIIRNSISIVTTKANSMMAFIHNKPKGSDEPRMPVIVPNGMEEQWLTEINDKTDQERVMDMIRPFDENEMKAYTVRRLRGKEGVGNVPEAIEEFEYSEL